MQAKIIVGRSRCPAGFFGRNGFHAATFTGAGYPSNQPESSGCLGAAATRTGFHFSRKRFMVPRLCRRQSYIIN
jgi:hypothetical protein